ncbi:MAG TPA: hypothetical protein PLU44_16770 [Candidatus Krumholzibacteria bacterium]|nr:hypothetical protein [Candidatus Krumholzibacteria bacterium]
MTSEEPRIRAWATPQKPPSHFTLVLGRIAHIAIGNHATLCGRALDQHPRRHGLNVQEALARAQCQVCKSCLRP